MVYRADIAVQSSDGRLLAVVEIKNREHLTAEVATVIRRNLIAHGLVPELEYFLLLSQDRGYLWAGLSLPQLEAPPKAAFSMSPVISRYVPPRDSSDRLRELELELLVVHWLTELAAGACDPTQEPESILAGTGFLKAIQGASILVEPRL